MANAAPRKRPREGATADQVRTSLGPCHHRTTAPHQGTMAMAPPTMLAYQAHQMTDQA